MSKFYKAVVIQNFSNSLKEYFCLEMIKRVQELHSLGIAHLDLKPDNFLVNNDYSLCLHDFDFQEKPCDVETSKYCGTIGYMAPEVEAMLDLDNA